MRTLACSSALLFALLACSDDGGMGGDADGGTDSMVNPGGDCREGGMATSDRFLPLDVGNIWRYNVTEVGTGNTETKRTELTEMMTPEGHTEPVIVQVTTKANGQTVSWMRQEGDKVVRLQQEDYDANGALERTTVYEPPKLRLDETAQNIQVGASFDDAYTKIIYDPDGTETSRDDIVDHWLVVSDSENCSTPWGTVTCTLVQREGIVGPTTVSKDYYFARGYGKMLEEGQQVEELTDCSLQ